MKDILSKYTERLANKKAKAIDDFISGYIPSWQQKIMFRLPITKKLFGYKIVHRTVWKDFVDALGEKIELKKHGKLLGTLTITENHQLKEEG